MSDLHGDHPYGDREWCHGVWDRAVSSVAGHCTGCHDGFDSFWEWLRSHPHTVHVGYDGEGLPRQVRRPRPVLELLDDWGWLWPHLGNLGWYRPRPLPRYRRPPRYIPAWARVTRTSATRDFIFKCMRPQVVLRPLPPPDAPLAAVDWFGDRS